MCSFAQLGHGARAVGLALGKRECADLDARHGEELQRLLGLVRSAAGAAREAGGAEGVTSSMKPSIRAALVASLDVTDFVKVRIPIQSGRGFRFGAGHHSDLKPAAIPR
jgi:hypothetical protein